MANWYYAENDTRHGPVPLSEIERLIDQGGINADTLVWREGLQGWEAASAHFPQLEGAAPPPPLTATRPSPGAGSPPPIQPQAPSVSQMGNLGSDGLYVEAPSRSFGEAISVCFSKYVTFKGRASRSEYWFYVLFLVLAGIGASILDAILFPVSIESGGPINGILTLATFLPTLAVSWRRLHDTDRSGWWIGGFYLALIGVGVIIFGMLSGGNEDAGVALLGVIALGALVYGIVLLVFFCQKGTLGPNRYG